MALIAVMAGTYVVVEHGLRTTPRPAATGARTTTTPRGTQRRYAHSRYYVVRSGDDLGAIAARTGVDVGRIEELNPRLDPNSLQPGQRLRIRR